MARAQDPQLARDAATQVVRTLRDAGHEAYFAGGCVRDELLGLHPTDYDVATDATPARVTALFHGTIQVGASFGVVLVPVNLRAARCAIEVATFRSDGTYADARRPDHVTFADKHADAQRRDFTINALFLDPLETAPSPQHTASPLGGRVLDLVGGLADLKANILRAVGDPVQRLAEDHLRALRAVRFAARLGFSIEPATSAALTRDAGSLRGVSRERVGAELRRMLMHRSRAVAADLLQQHALDAPALDEAPTRAALPRLLALPEPGLTGLPDGRGQFPGECPAPEELYPGVALAAWAADRGHAAGFEPDPESTTRRLRRALCLSNDEAATLQRVLSAFRDLTPEWLGRPSHEQKRSIARAGFSEALWLRRATDPILADRVLNQVGLRRASASGIAPEPLVNGGDLLRLGAQSGPMFKIVLDAVFDRQLADDFSDVPDPKTAALTLARTLLANGGYGLT